MTRSWILGAGALVAGVSLAASPAGAQVPATAKCNAAKVKCAATYGPALLGCHNKAEGKGEPVDPECITKAETKFTLPVKGCIEKAESKPPCSTTGDAASLQATIDAFVDDIVTDLDPGYPTPILNKCSAGKKKCVATKAKALLSCYQKNITKPDPLKFGPCLQKAMDKFDGGDKPEKGCFAKLEAKPPCLTTGDTAAIEAKVDAFAAAIAAAVGPGTSSLRFSTVAPGGACGQVLDGASGVIKDLTCGGLNIGGGLSIVPEGPVPDGSTSEFGLSCTGSSCTLEPTTAIPPVNSAAPDCTNTGCNFGTPLPIPNPTIPAITTCVLNTWAAPASGTLDLSNGTSTTSVPLASDIYLTGNVAQPCPRCSASGSPSSPATGTCDRGPRTGMACTTTSSTGVTRDCPTGGANPPTLPCTPGGGLCIDGSHVGVISVNLTPLTTGAASDTDPAGLFCPGQVAASAGCFGAPGCRTIVENGQAAGPITPGVPATGRLASVFCIAATNNGLVDASANLPGPGAVSLPGSFVVN